MWLEQGFAARVWIAIGRSGEEGKAGVEGRRWIMFNVDHGGGHVCAELDTRSDEGYASGGEVLPGGRSVAGRAAGVAADAGRSSAGPAVSDGFACTRERFEALLGWASSGEAGALEHSEFEERLASDGREVLRCLFQDSLDLRARCRDRRVPQRIPALGLGWGRSEWTRSPRTARSGQVATGSCDCSSGLAAGRYYGQRASADHR